MDNESLANLTAFSERMWESFAPVREFIEKHPECREPLVKALGEVATESFREHFMGPIHRGEAEMWPAPVIGPEDAGQAETQVGKTLPSVQQPPASSIKLKNE